MTRPFIAQEDGIRREMTEEEYDAVLLDRESLRPTRAQWEAAAKRRADELLAMANDIVRQLLAEYQPGSSEHTTLLALSTSFIGLTSSQSLAASTDEASAFQLLMAAYQSTVNNQVPMALKIKYSAIVNLWRKAGRKI